MDLHVSSLQQVFLSLHLWKSIFRSSFYQRVFFYQFVDRKVTGLVPKYYLLAGDTSQVSNVFNYIRQKWVIYPLNHLLHISLIISSGIVFHKGSKSLSFCEIWNDLTPPLFFIRPLTNKHCGTWSSVVNFWINSRTY